MKCNIHLNKFRLDFYWFRNSRFSNINPVTGYLLMIYRLTKASGLKKKILTNKLFCKNIICIVTGDDRLYRMILKLTLGYDKI